MEDVTPALSELPALGEVKLDGDDSKESIVERLQSLESERYELREKLLGKLSPEEARKVLIEQAEQAEFEAQSYRMILKMTSQPDKPDNTGYLPDNFDTGSIQTR